MEIMVAIFIVISLDLIRAGMHVNIASNIAKKIHFVKLDLKKFGLLAWII